uniref:Uncharacterized protein n=1 Tax=Glossina palpalis gambiensis TaxID=67801 RepID=A0A1B0B3N3_9MUSC
MKIRWEICSVFNTSSTDTKIRKLSFKGSQKRFKKAVRKASSIVIGLYTFSLMSPCVIRLTLSNYTNQT